MKLKLPDSIASSQDLASLLIDIRNYSRWFAHESIKKQVSAKHASEPPIVSDAAIELLRTCDNKSDIEALIDTLEKYKKSAPSITITLAAPPTGGVKATLVSWCRKNIAPDILVTFRFNSILLGGMVIRCGSRILDLSFRRKILAARQNFPEVLRRV